MTRVRLVCAALLVSITVYGAQALAAPVTPGELHVVDKHEPTQIKAAANDMVEIRISNPVLPKRVHDVRVDARGATVLSGVVDTTNGLPGGDRISIFVKLLSPARTGTIDYSYKDGADTEFKSRVSVRIVPRVEPEPEK